MAISKVVYGATTLVDLTADTVTADGLVEGHTAHDKAGNKVTGTNPYAKTETDTTVNTQADLIEQIQTALADKAGMSGGNELIVTAPTGSTVTVSNGNKTKTATENGGTWTFSGLDGGTWTITATKGSNTATKTVTFVDEQSAEISYYVDNFADNDWATIIKMCQSNSVPSTWTVGSSKTMTINGKSYQIDIIGVNHDTYTSGGTAPLTFQMHDCYATTYVMNSTNTNSGGYDSSAMHTTHLPAILNLMPSEVKAAIKPVNKKSGTGGESSSGVETVSCNLFLLAEIEIFGSTSYSVSGEGTQYAYYKAGNSKIKYLNGSAQYWWERSPRSGDSRFFGLVAADGSADLYGAYYVGGVAFGFCF